ncbi:MAG: GNAT family N-acetyltransferase [Burkholderiaceae bacterium]|nr:GNAT family N-acetyltransferase [Burkholderiaceae bacterium]
MTIRYRPMSEHDIADVLLIQRAQYEGRFIEPESVIRARLASFPDTCWIAIDEEGACAYLVGYHSVVGEVIPLGGDFVAHENPDCLYVHDLAVLPRTVGRGIGRNLVRLAWKTSVDAGVRHSALISVQDSNLFWQRLGYEQKILTDKVQQTYLASYDETACYMTRPLV